VKTGSDTNIGGKCSNIFQHTSKIGVKLHLF